jgi:hypothetical protein
MSNFISKKLLVMSNHTVRQQANKALHLTAYSVRSCVAPASGGR